MRRLIIAGLAIVVVVAIVAIASSFSLSALPEPGQAEMFLAAKAKHYLVRRSSRAANSPRPHDDPANIKEGKKLFGTDCAQCHGLSGHDPTDAGRWMYPRAAILTSRETQSYSDQEIFWIIKNGIRLTGMPAFGRVEPDDHIWDLVLYVRSLPDAAAAER